MAMRNLVGILMLACVGAVMSASAEEEKAPIGYTDTPQIPGSKWRVHDIDRPRPAVVKPGDKAGAAPADAIVLFDGKNLEAWQNAKGGTPGWKVEKGYMEVVAGSGNIATKQKFGDCQLHVEFQSPTPVKGSSQERGNSGVFLSGLYEIQVLDSFDNLTYADGQASAVYGQTPPQVNASRPPGEWQSYDIIYTAPRFDHDKIVTPGYVTVFHNGVLTQNHTQLLGGTVHRALPKQVVHDVEGSIELQDHHTPVRFRNIWVRPIKDAP